MKTTTLTSMMTCVWKVMRKHSPEILTALGIAGFTTAAVMAVKVTPKALEKVRQDSQKNHNGDRYAYTKKEAVASAWRHYVPAVGVGLSSETKCSTGYGIFDLGGNTSGLSGKDT